MERLIIILNSSQNLRNKLDIIKSYSDFKNFSFLHERNFRTLRPMQEQQPIIT